MPKVLYGISPIGLGHATRSTVIVEGLRRGGAEVRVFSGGNAAGFLRETGLQVDDLVDDAVPEVRGLEMRNVALWYLRSWLAQRRNVRRVSRLIGSYKPDLVVCDEEFSGMAAAEAAGLRRVFIADELELGFARGWLAGKLEARVARWYAGLLGSVDLLIVPEAGEDGGNRRFVGPIVRKATEPCAALKERHGIPGGRSVLFSMSGSGIGGEVGVRLLGALEEERLRDVTLVVSGNRGQKFVGPRVLDLGPVPDNQNLVTCSDLVVSTAGKSTMDEAAAAGVPIVVIPIRHHAEQERNAAGLGFRYEDLDRLGELIAERIGDRSEPKEFTGGARATELILSLLGVPSL